VGGPLVPLAGSLSGGVEADPWQPSEFEDESPNEFIFFGRALATLDVGTGICEEESRVCSDCSTS